MSAWDDLLAVALLGTNHQQLGALTENGSLGGMLTSIQTKPDRSPEQVILNAAATINLHQRAGRLPTTQLSSDILPAEDEKLPAITNLSAFHVQQLLDEYRATVLPEWLQSVAENKKRIPDIFLPAFLEQATQNEGVRERLAHVLGERGLWLTAQNPLWKGLAARSAGGTDEDALKRSFETGVAEERVQALKSLRQSNAQLARQLIESTWSEDSHQHRAAFLQTLSSNLSMSDEPFLEETVLSDKRKEIRSVAANLLARLPESRLHQRMFARVEPLIKLKGLLKKGFDISFPQECDATMIRDGIDAKPASDTNLDRPLWLSQMLSYIDPEFWEKRFQSSPESLLAAIEARELYAQYLIKGLHSATVLHKRSSWAKAFINSDLIQTYDDLMRSLSAAEKETLFLALMTKNDSRLSEKGTTYQRLLALLPSLRHNWSESFSRKIAAAICGELASGTRDNSWHLSYAISSIGYYMHLSLVDSEETASAFKRLGLTESGDVQAVDKLFSIMQFRKDVYSILKL